MCCKKFSSKFAVLIFSVLAISGVYLMNDRPANEISYDEALNRIQNRQISEVHLKDRSARLTLDADRRLTIPDLTDGQKEGIVKAVFDINRADARSAITLTEEPAPFVFFDSAHLFQILFILFIVSPPLIVVLLFLIWRELKARNRMK